MSNTALEETFITLCCIGRSQTLFHFSIFLLGASVSRNTETFLADECVYLTCFQIIFLNSKLTQSKEKQTTSYCIYPKLLLEKKSYCSINYYFFFTEKRFTLSPYASELHQVTKTFLLYSLIDAKSSRVF